jgi:Integrase core domain.
MIKRLLIEQKKAKYEKEHPKPKPHKELTDDDKKILEDIEKGISSHVEHLSKDDLKKAEELTKPPRKETGENISHFPSKGQIAKNIEQQADLIHMPTDRVYIDKEKEKVIEYKYILVVIDIGSRIVAARPLTNKEPNQIVKMFKAIYEHSELKLPDQIDVDAGKEFRGDTEKYFKDNNVFVHRAEPNRHDQQSIVEANNRIIVKKLFNLMDADELKT